MANVRVLYFEVFDYATSINWIELKKRLDQVSIDD